LDAQSFKTAVSQVVFSASTNQTQPEISGVFLGIDEQGLRLAATDRYRLAEKKVAVQNPQRIIQEVIIPHKTAVETSRIIGSMTGDLQICLGGNQIVFNFQNTTVVSRLVDGQYPPYQQIIPQTFNTVITTKKNPFTSALKAGGIFSQNGNSVKLEYLHEGQKLVLSSESGELGKNIVGLPSLVEGQSGALILNYHYILDCLNSIESDEVIIRVVDDNSPTLINPKTQEGLVYLIMPIKN
jgi:DNA polymerase-3 subunit beta